MPFCDELAAAAGSRMVKDMMIIRFRREVSVTLCEEAEQRKKAAAIRSRVAERDFVIGELELLCGTDSALVSISHLTRLQTEDLTEVSLLLVDVMKKQARVTDLLAFIEKLKSMEY